jgi:hypothetical protein
MKKKKITNTKLFARLVVHDVQDLTNAQVRSLVKWLREQANTLSKKDERNMLSRRSIARFIGIFEEEDSHE